MKKNIVKIYRILLFIVLITSLIVIAFKIPASDLKNLYTLSLQHLQMVFISMTLATIIGFGVGVIFSRKKLKRFQGIIMYIVGLGQTIPALAVLALTMSFLGIGMKPAIFALTIYTILPIARNTLAGINSISNELIDAARGLGLSPLRILVEVELPNAAPVIMAGIRTSFIINIGTAALGSLVGAGGLGEQIFTGISFLDPWVMLSGALPTACFALVGDYIIRYIEDKIVSEGVKG